MQIRTEEEAQQVSSGYPPTLVHRKRSHSTGEGDLEAQGGPKKASIFRRWLDRVNILATDTTVIVSRWASGVADAVSRRFKLASCAVCDVLLNKAIGTNRAGYEKAKVERGKAWDELTAGFQARSTFTSTTAGVILGASLAIIGTKPIIYPMDWRSTIPQSLAMTTCLLSFCFYLNNIGLHTTTGTSGLAFSRFLSRLIRAAFLFFATSVCGVLAVLASVFAGGSSPWPKLAVTLVAVYLLWDEVQSIIIAYSELRASQVGTAPVPATPAPAPATDPAPIDQMSASYSGLFVDSTDSDLRAR